MLSCPLPLRRRVLTLQDRIAKSWDMPTSALRRTMRMRSPGPGVQGWIRAVLALNVKGHVLRDEVNLANRRRVVGSPQDVTGETRHERQPGDDCDHDERRANQRSVLSSDQ